MASIRKVKDKWLAEVRLKGLSVSKTHPTKIQAQSWAIEQEQKHGKHGGVVKGKTLKEALRRYALEISPQKKGARWEEIRLKKLEGDPLADILLINLTRDDMQAWIDRRGKQVKAGSVNRELTILSSVLRECRTSWKWMMDNPIIDTRRPKDPPHRDRRISDDEIKRILLALEYEEGCEVITIRQQIAIAFLLAIETAMRQGEIWGLTLDNIHLSKKYVTLPDTKNGTRRDVALSKRAIELLEKLMDGQKKELFTVSAASAGVIFRRALQMAEIKNLTFHDSRHEAITRLAKKLSLLPLARMVGHRDPRSLMIYYNETASEIAESLD